MLKSTTFFFNILENKMTGGETTNLAPHHHLVCIKCGKIVDVRNNDKQLLKKSPVDYQTGAALSDWHVDTIKIEFIGICPDCRK